jgi:tetratricopeptide (TPR) repeat protein
MGRFKNLEVNQPEPEELLASGKKTDTVRDEQFYLREADTARRHGFYENALRYYSRSLEFNKSLVEAWVGQVRMLVELEEYPEAVVWSTKAMELFRENPDLMAGKAQAFARRGDAPSAVALSDGAIQKPGQSAYRWLVRGELMVATRQRTDQYLFDKAALADPDWLVLLDIGRVYMHYDEPARALPWTRRAVERAPIAAYAVLCEGICHAKSGNVTLARQRFEQCLQLIPGYREAELELAKLRNKNTPLLSRLKRLMGAQQ